ncbi:hypothetical protein Ahia01_000255800, partial [Argonauta hians]
DGYTFSMENNCAGYWTCINKEQVGKCCPKLHSFQTNKCVPDFRCNHGCQISSEPDEDICKNKPNNIELPVHGECRTYWKCYHGKATKKCCLYGYAFKEGRGCQRDYTCRERCNPQTTPSPTPNPNPD